MKAISKLHYITQTGLEKTHSQQAELACKGGVKWVQLRLKKESEEEKLKEALLVKNICKEYGATFIINDHVELAKEVFADGVHLGKTDMPIPEAKKILGEGRIYGGTANTPEDIQKLINWEADYIGYGPFRFTSTKENLSPIVGLKGFQEIVKLSQTNNWTTPIIAIGGIKIGDVELLLEEKIHGIAIASPINLAEDPVLIAKKFTQKTLI